MNLGSKRSSTRRKAVIATIAMTAAILPTVEHGIAASASRLAIEGEALPHGSTKLSPTMVQSTQATPLEQAIIDNDYGQFMKLLRAGEDPNVQGWHGSTAMHLAAQHQNIHYLEQLLENGGDPNVIASRLKRPPLFNALDTRRTRNRDLLIKHGANIEQEDSSGNRPLKHAADIHDSGSVLRLLELGADPKAKNDIGATFQSSFFRGDPKVMTWTALRHYRKVIAILEERDIPLDPKADRYR
ncbi:ankyrin repeat domain-containing protein [Shinella oryzae]|uniref:Ankyrin repeat domain-containing protein n=1 Tax=Shinella oryzae TaxID=2871820 RepID=A0ABY9K8U8_9HYPH|nr:ankyrin repeat domain-containing protein [Shinella oryzae]WLS05005.1 ankyrin repeat domain-containing protein [Shinella oryzae]